MELFGNKLIGGKVEGQKDLERKGQTDELLRSQLLVLKKDNPSQYNEVMRHLENLKRECESSVWAESGEAKPSDCETIKYDYLLATKAANAN